MRRLWLPLSSTLGVTSVDAECQIKEKIIGLLGKSITEYFPTPPIHHEALWASAVFENLRKSVATGNAEAMEVATSFIEKDPIGIPFGKLIKSDLARALKKHVSQIPQSNRSKIIEVTVRLLKNEYSPRELEDYAKLVKKFPSSEYIDKINEVATKSEKARKIQRYLNENP